MMGFDKRDDCDLGIIFRYNKYVDEFQLGYDITKLPHHMSERQLHLEFRMNCIQQGIAGIDEVLKNSEIDHFLRFNDKLLCALEVFFDD